MSTRIHQLDSIRGLAALTVFLNHLPLVNIGLPLVIIHTIQTLRLINGHGAVMLFFVLSGFVLSLPILKYEKIHYFPYLIKRFYRIYIPYLISIVATMILSQIFLDFDRGNIHTIIGDQWKESINLNLIFEHILLLGNIHSDTFNGVIWSLVHELRISLIFPFIVFVIAKYSWKLSISLCLLFSGISGINCIVLLQPSNGLFTSYFHTMNYLSFFVIGALIAKYKDIIIIAFQKLPILIKSFLLVTCLFIFNYSDLIVTFLYQITGWRILSAFHLILLEYAQAIGAAGIIVIALASKILTKFLLFKPVAFLGKVSFSLYLLHSPIIAVSFYLLNGKVNLISISIVAFLLSIIISTLAYHYIEVPCINAGKKLANRYKTKSESVKEIVA